MSSKKSTPPPFVNKGLERWEQCRIEWNKPKGTPKQRSEIVSNLYFNFDLSFILILFYQNEKDLNVEDILQRIFSPESDGRLTHPLPLPQLIDILVDFWEADGLYD